VIRASAPRPSVANKALRALILAYQAASSGRSPACRFVPSCSDYALEAIGRFGARKGIPLMVRRLARCRPGGPFGFDPVPDGPNSSAPSSDDLRSEGLSSETFGSGSADHEGPDHGGTSPDSSSPDSSSPGARLPEYSEPDYCGPDYSRPGHSSPDGRAIDRLVAPAGSGAEKRTA
jgi:uncharacterized protein